jgi:3-hydroxyisobutyrate dehydrogenase
MSRSFATAHAGGKKVGFIGLGNMGLPMADNLRKAGFEVTGYDVGEKQRKSANEANIIVADSVHDAVKDADWIITALPKTEHVETVLTQPQGIFESAKKGTYICDVSTINPQASIQFNAEAAKRDLVFLDTPMSGGITGAHAGTLTFMVGANEVEQFEHAK